MGSMTKPTSRHAAAGKAALRPALRAKLLRLPLATDFVPRAEIMKRLTDPVDRPLTLVSASAGYGKSTLVSSWLETAACPSGWLSLDEYDSDTRQFLAHFLAAAQTMFPTAGKATKTLLGTHKLPTPSVIADTLLNDLNKIGKRFMLALDDYHHIGENDVHDIMAALINHPPRGMHLILLTRRDPPLPLSALRGLGRINEISAAQLRFSIAETSAFLKNTSCFRLMRPQL